MILTKPKESRRNDEVYSNCSSATVRFVEAVNQLVQVDGIKKNRRCSNPNLYYIPHADDNKARHILIPPAPWEAMVQFSWYPFLKLMLDNSFNLTKGTVSTYSNNKVTSYTPYNII